MLVDKVIPDVGVEDEEEDAGASGPVRQVFWKTYEVSAAVP